MRRSLALLFAVAAAAMSWFAPAVAKPADDAAIVRSIQVDGNQRVEESAVIEKMALHAGERYSPALVDQSLKALYATGLFSDVKIELLTPSSVVVVKVVENPTIDRVLFEGNEALQAMTLREELQLKPRMVLTRAKVEADVQRLLEIYRRSGRWSAEVVPKTVQRGQNRVDLVYDIKEGAVTGVNAIVFIGNHAFSGFFLKRKLATSESAWWNITQTSDRYDPDRLMADRELLRRFYLSKGYAAFRIVSAVAELAPDRSGFTITFTLDEGERYRFGKVAVDTQLKRVALGDLDGVVGFKTGDRYDADLIDRAGDDLARVLDTKGYTFVKVAPHLTLDKAALTANVSYAIEETPHLFVDRIDIVGNTRTLDRVIRNQMCLIEGGPLSPALLERSRARLKSLGFFKTIAITDVAGAAEDRRVVTVDVEEDQTGEFYVSAGSSSAELDIGQKNLYGTGHALLLRLGVGVPGPPAVPSAALPKAPDC